MAKDTHEDTNIEEKMLGITQLNLRGTELSEAVQEFWKAQRGRIEYQLKIIFAAKRIFQRMTKKELSPQAAKILDEFQEALAQKKGFEKSFLKAEKGLKELGEWNKCETYFNLYEIIKKKKKFSKIIDFIEPPLSELGEWSDWRKSMFFEYEEKEKEMLKKITESVESRRIWINWLKNINGVGLLLTAQIIGGFESALNAGETFGKHYKNPSQAKSFSGCGAPVQRKKNEKLSFNMDLKSALLGRLADSFLKQSSEKSKYRKFYDEKKAELIRRFEREGKKIVPAAQLPAKNGKKYEPEGMISKGHIHRMAIRKMIQLFICHFWEVSRKAEGLPAGPDGAYAFTVLGHSKSGYIPPFTDKEE